MKNRKKDIVKKNLHLFFSILIFLILMLTVFLAYKKRLDNISEENLEIPKLNDNKVEISNKDKKKEPVEKEPIEKEKTFDEKQAAEVGGNEKKDFFYENPVSDTMTEQEKDEIISDLPYELREKAYKYPETESTMVKYPELKDQNNEIDISKDLDLASKNPKGKNIPYFSQWDERWAFKYLQDTFMAESACGPTALSSVYVGLTGDKSMNPYEMAKFASKNGWYFSSGSSRDLMSYGPELLGLETRQIYLDKDEIKAGLDRDSLIILLVHAGDFTGGGHFIVLINYDEEGLIIMDPNSYINTNKKWDFDRILDQTSIGWEISK